MLYVFVCIFVDFGYCMDPLSLTTIHHFTCVEISPRCSVINRDLPWKQSIILIYFFFNSMEYFIANNRTLQFTSRHIVTSSFSFLATTDIDLARLRHSTYPSVLVSACQMMNWPNKFLIWSSTSTLALSIGTLQRKAAQITDKHFIQHFCLVVIFKI